MVFGAGPSLQMSREAPKPDQEPELEVAARNRFQCDRRRRPIETVCLRGRGLGVWRRTIRANTGMQIETIVTVVVVMGVRPGRLGRIVDTSVRVVMEPHVTTVTRSTLHHLKSRIRTRCAYCFLQDSLSYSSPAIYGSAPRSL